MESEKPGKEYSGRRYEVLPSDENWPELFAAEAEKLRTIFAGADVQHVGSTSVPGLDSKPTIDILVRVDEMAAAEEHADEMTAAGYKDLGAYVMPGSRLFVKEREGGGDRLFNVHVFPKDHPHAKDMIAMRDYFREHPEETERYARLKRDLATRYPDDYGEYRKQKDAYMEELKGRVLHPQKER